MNEETIELGWQGGPKEKAKLKLNIHHERYSLNF